MKIKKDARSLAKTLLNQFIIEIASAPESNPLQTGYTNDIAELASISPTVYKTARDSGYLEQFCQDYNVDAEDKAEIEEFVSHQASIQTQERFLKVIHFFLKCGVPRAVCAASASMGGEKNIVQLASDCKVSKQAIHKHLKVLKPHFQEMGKFDLRERNFKNSKPTNQINEHNH